MSTQSARRLRQEDLQRATIKTRLAQYRSRVTPCNCHACRAVANIRAMVAAGEVVQVQDNTVAQVLAGETTKH